MIVGFCLNFIIYFLLQIPFMIIQGQPDIVNPIVTRYCWIMSTFTLPKYYEGTPGKDIMYPGVGKIIPLFDFGNFIKQVHANEIGRHV